MPQTHFTIEERLSQAYITLSNAGSDSTVQSILAAHGYTSERINDGWTLYNTAQTRCQEQENAYGALTRASQELQESERNGRALFAGHRAMTLVIFRDDEGSLRDLGLHERRLLTRAVWLARARQFYRNALASSAIQTRLATVGITTTILNDGLQLINTIERHVATRLHRKGEAKAATTTRDSALTALEKWIRDFRAIARVALRGRPQALETLGIRA